MEIQLLDKIRNLKRFIDEPKISDITMELNKMFCSNVLILDAKGKILGISKNESVCNIEEFIDVSEGMYIDSCLNERFLSVLSINDNVYLPAYGFSENTKSFRSIIAPIEIMGERFGTLIIYRKNTLFDIEDILLSEYSIMLIGMHLYNVKRYINKESEQAIRIIRNLVDSLNINGLTAMQCLLEELAGKDQILVVTDFCSKYGVSRSTVVYLIKKMEASGAIRTRSLGRKGTEIIFCNKIPFEELLELTR